MLRRVIRYALRRLDINGPGFRLYRHDIGDYMHRLILEHPFGTVRLHRIRRADEDHELHDHPWDFVTFILKGGYVEVVPMSGCMPAFSAVDEDTEELIRPPGSVVYHPAQDPHRIDRLLDKEAVTLVFTGPRVRRWGFWHEDGWMFWRHHELANHTPDSKAGYIERLDEIRSQDVTH